MAAPEITAAELEARLAALHEESFGWALSCCGWDHTDAEDVLQTTYLRVVSGEARFGGRSAFRTWLFGVIRHVARELHRRARVHRAGAERLTLEVAAEGGAATPSHDPAEQAESRQMLLAALAELPARQQETLHLVFYHDLTIAEAAEVMDVSLGSARVHYERGKKRLRQLLAGRVGREDREDRDMGARSQP